MSQDKQKSIAAMRTFARDLDRERGHTDSEPAGTTPSKSDVAPDTKSHVATAPKSIPDVPRTSVPPAPPIPAFHELQKNNAVKTAAPTLQAAPTTKKKSKAGIVASKQVGGGTIITDTKIEKSSFFAALSASLVSWAQNLKKQFKPKPKRTYAVTSTERRRGVVQKATSKTGAIFSADKAELQAIIRKRQLEEGGDAHGEPELEWSPFTEPGFLLLDGDHETIVANNSKPTVVTTPLVTITPKQHVKATVFEPPAPPPPVAPPVSTPAPAPVVVTPAVPVITPLPPTPTPEPKPIVRTEPVTDEVVEPEEFEDEVMVADDREPSSSPVRFWSIDHLTNLSTNEMTVLVVGALLVVSIGGFVGYTVFTSDTTPTITEAPATPLSITNLALRPLLITPADSSRSLIVTAAESERAVELITVRADGTIDSSFLRDSISSDGESFLLASREARIIVTAAGERVLIVPIADAINARGGLLDWETTMYRDMGVMLGYLPQTAVPATYVDALIGTIDTRQVRDGQQVVLVYGFGTSELVIIAPSTNAFAEALSVLKD